MSRVREKSVKSGNFDMDIEWQPCQSPTVPLLALFQICICSCSSAFFKQILFISIRISIVLKYSKPIVIYEYFSIC